MRTSLLMMHSTAPIVRFQGKHVHGPDCNHDHASEEVSHVHEHHNHDHHEHSHEPVQPKLGDAYKNPIIRGVMNFLGWFYELFRSFVQDLRGTQPHKEDAHHHPH
ncbi:MAG TPA: hypothetical protein V6C99_02365 [Oculatellaceae cyanobacterium]|jgi:hypothetical protein